MTVPERQKCNGESNVNEVGKVYNISDIAFKIPKNDTKPLCSKWRNAGLSGTERYNIFPEDIGCF